MIASAMAMPQVTWMEPLSLQGHVGGGFISIELRVLPCLTPREQRTQVIRRVADAYEVSVDDLLSRRRDGVLVMARRAAIVAVYQAFPDSLPMLGRLFDRDHTTILHHLRVAKCAKEASNAG